jgi:hypothetical protein
MASKKISEMELGDGSLTPYDRIPLITPNPLTWDGESEPTDYVNRTIDANALGGGGGSAPVQTLLLDMQAGVPKNTNTSDTWDVQTVLQSDDAEYVGDGLVAFVSEGVFEVSVTAEVEVRDSNGDPTDWPLGQSELFMHVQGNNYLHIVPARGGGSENAYRTTTRNTPLQSYFDPSDTMCLTSMFYFNVTGSGGTFRLNTIIKNADNGGQLYQTKAAVTVKKIGPPHIEV